MDFTALIDELIKGLSNFTLGNAVMILIGATLIGLAIIKEYDGDVRRKQIIRNPDEGWDQY
jgi:Na+-transporting methylmalonyl-CoA/oxaloacetate decarboxylase beta subunit